MTKGSCLGLAALWLASCAGTPTVAPTSSAQAAVGRGVGRLQREAEATRSLVRSRWAAEFLASAALLPNVAPRQVAGETVDEVGYYYGRGASPIFTARLLELLGETERRSLVGRRLLDLAPSSIGPLRMLAAAGGDVVALSSSERLRQLYSLPGDQGSVPLLGREVSGHLSLVFGRLAGQFPTDEAARQAVGSGYDALLAQNLLTRGHVHPSDAAPPETQLQLGLSDEEYLRLLVGLLKQGGRMVLYNLCPAPSPAGQPYNPHADCRNPFPQAQWQAAGFRVIDYDRSDTPSAREFIQAIDGATGTSSAPDKLFALYTLVERL